MKDPNKKVFYEGLAWMFVLIGVGVMLGLLKNGFCLYNCFC